MLNTVRGPLDAQYDCEMLIAQYIDRSPWTVNIIVQYFRLSKLLYRVETMLEVVQYIVQSSP